MPLTAARPGLVLLVFLAVGLVLLAALLPAPRLPVDVYGTPAPTADILPEDLLPASLAGLNRTAQTSNSFNGSADAAAEYEGGAAVKVTRFNASNASDAGGEASRALAAQAADDLLDRRYGTLDAAHGARVCVREGGRHWFAQTGPGSSVLAWRAGNFVFEVSAPTASLRDSVARDLTD